MTERGNIFNHYTRALSIKNYGCIIYFLKGEAEEILMR